MTTPHAPKAPAPLVEKIIEQVIFNSRWILAPIYMGLIAGLIALLVKFSQKTFDLVLNIGSTSGDAAIIGVLGLVDLALMAGLVLMVMFAGYENFVSKFDLGDHEDQPAWMGRIDFADLKLKLMASIVAISAIHVLESFMNIEHLTDRELGWSVGIHLTFVVSGVLLAVMDRMSGEKHA